MSRFFSLVYEGNQTFTIEKSDPTCRRCLNCKRKKIVVNHAEGRYRPLLCNGPLQTQRPFYKQARRSPASEWQICSLQTANTSSAKTFESWGTPNENYSINCSREWILSSMDNLNPWPRQDQDQKAVVGQNLDFQLKSFALEWGRSSQVFLDQVEHTEEPECKKYYKIFENLLRECAKKKLFMFLFDVKLSFCFI